MDVLQYTQQLSTVPTQFPTCVYLCSFECTVNSSPFSASIPSRGMHSNITTKLLVNYNHSPNYSEILSNHSPVWRSITRVQHIATYQLRSCFLPLKGFLSYIIAKTRPKEVSIRIVRHKRTSVLWKQGPCKAVSITGNSDSILLLCTTVDLYLDDH